MDRTRYERQRGTAGGGAAQADRKTKAAPIAVGLGVQHASRTLSIGASMISTCGNGVQR